MQVAEAFSTFIEEQIILKQNIDDAYDDVDDDDDDWSDPQVVGRTREDNKNNQNKE